MICSAKVGNVEDTNEFILPLAAPTTNTEFESILNSAVKDFEMKNYESDIVNPQAEYQKAKFYKPGEIIKGYIDDTTAVKKIFKPESRLNF